MQMTHDALQIEASGNGHMMQMRLGQPPIGGAPQARGAHCLRDGPFNASTPRVLLDKGSSALLRAALDERCMHLGRREGERAALLPTGTLGR